MYIYKESFQNRREILASDKYVSFTVTIKSADIQADANGKKIVKAGTVYPANDARAEGLILNDVDVTHGDQPAALLVEGYIYEERLPEAISTEAKTSLVEIKARKSHDA